MSAEWAVLTVGPMFQRGRPFLFDEVGVGSRDGVHVCSRCVGERAVVFTAYS